MSSTSLSSSGTPSSYLSNHRMNLVVWFNFLTKDMLLERERLYTIMGIRRTGWNARKLDHAAKFISLFDKYELGGPNDDNDVDDIIEDPDYVPTM